MKVVLFCGGLGMRLREYSEAVPKPMVPVGTRPILWHIMKYYAHFGHKEFILCLGWHGNVIKDYFLNYNECLSNDFVMTRGGSVVRLLASDIDDWNITFVDTGTTACIGQRLRAVADYVRGEDTFLANYADGLTDFDLPRLVDFYRDRDATAAFLAVRPRASFHAVDITPGGRVAGLRPIDQSGVWMNGGFFVLNRRVFDYLHDGEELVIEAFERLINDQALCCLQYEGFWSCMDTYKEKQQLDDMFVRGDTPWQLWKQSAPNGRPREIVRRGVRARPIAARLTTR